jgi:hypothetical protein
MQLFFSHSSDNKPLIREVAGYLPGSDRNLVSGPVVPEGVDTDILHAEGV